MSTRPQQIQAESGEPASTSARGGLRRNLTLSLGSLGVVYGDIGTSPLYAVRQCLLGSAPVGTAPVDVMGVLSLIFWALILVVSVKYLVFMMRADNEGEGGVLALLALVDPWKRHPGTSRAVLIFLGIFGAALLYGDGMITPAISVLSAVEGLQVAAPNLQEWIIPLTVVILIALFLLQRRGSGGIGAIFGPMMIVWFVLLALLGVRGIAQNPAVLSAINPAYAIRFLLSGGLTGYLVLGGVFLVVTGGETLFADMGHFGRLPIRLAWFTIVLPCLLLNYFGQGAVILDDPARAAHPFYSLVPGWGTYIMVAVATLVTVIASQAVIAGAFSLARQAIQLGYSPRMNVVQTSPEEFGQIYVPVINWILMVATIALVIGFGSSSNLAAAYGIAVSTTMVLTTVLLFVVIRSRWRWPLPAAIAPVALFLTVDGAFLGANLFKVLDGGWVPLGVASLALFLMTTWHSGREILMANIRARSVPLEDFLESIEQHGPTRVPGTGVFLTAPDAGTPGGLLHHLKLNQVLHERVILLTVITRDVPRVPAAKRLEVEPLKAGFYRMHVYYGFMQTPDIATALRLCQAFGLIPDLNLDNIAYYADRASTVVDSADGRMKPWRKRIFAAMARNSERAIDYYRLPAGKSIELGIQVKI
ncbi:MAG TPA: KUP/HAK/KT family potassium transporter [Gammaproteobacteria bacterium]|nr:KUP/HAK/KT family potassium transporter [Gammaproteobacteria bacterium]